MQDWGFWAVAAALAAAVALILLLALRRAGAAADDGAALKVYRDQLAEVDRDLARAVITPAEAERLKTEVSRRLLDADRALRGARPASAMAPVLLPVLAVLAATGGALWLYDRLGAPGYPDLPISARLAMAEEAHANRPAQADAEAVAPAPAKPPQVDAEFTALMERLRAAVAQRPDDQQGLALLAHNEALLGNMVAARTAQAHLVALKGDQASVQDRMTLVDIMVAAAGGYVSPEAEAELMRVLQADPTNPLARYYTGLMFAQTGRPDRTFDLWEPLLREGPPDAPWIAPIEANLQGVADMAGIKYQMQAPATMPGGPSEADMAAAADMSPEDRQAMIAGMVGKREARLMAEGGPAEEWAQLINALAVLGEMDRARAALAAANAAYAGDAAALASIAAAASAAGVGP